MWSSYGDLKQRVVDPGLQPGGLREQQRPGGFQNLTGWSPLSAECEPTRYGSWATYQELVDRAYHSLRCSEPWLGQFIAYDIAQTRQVRGRGYATGECNTLLYRRFDQVFLSYSDFRTEVQQVHGALVAQGVTIESDGDVNVGGNEYDGRAVLTGSTGTGAPQAATLGGQVFSSQTGSNVIVVPNPASPIVSTYGRRRHLGRGRQTSSPTTAVNIQAGGNLIGHAGGN